MTTLSQLSELLLHARVDRVSNMLVISNAATGEDVASVSFTNVFDTEGLPVANDLPTNEPVDPYLAMLDDWSKNARLASHYKGLENEQRRMLFAGAFPNPKEGVQRHKLPDGRKLKGEYKIDRKIDEAALPATLQAMRDAGVANADSLVRFKPELAKREWNTLSDENKLRFSAAVIATPGMPTFAIEPAAETK